MAAASDLEVEDLAEEDLAEEDLAEVDLEEDLAEDLAEEDLAVVGAGAVEMGGMELNLGGLPFLFERRGSGACRSAPDVTVAEGTFLALNLSVFSLALPSVSTMDALKGRDVAWYLSASFGKLSTLFLEDFSMFFGILASMNLQYRILTYGRERVCFNMSVGELQTNLCEVFTITEKAITWVDILPKNPYFSSFL